MTLDAVLHASYREQLAVTNPAVYAERNLHLIEASLCLAVPGSNILPIDNLPDLLQIVCLYIVVLQVVRMLPHVYTKQRYKSLHMVMYVNDLQPKNDHTCQDMQFVFIGHSTKCTMEKQTST
jgi:hypothetical protein